MPRVVISHVQLSKSHILLFMPRINERGLVTHEGGIIDMERASKINYLWALI